MGVNGVFVAFVLIAPDLLEQSQTREHLAGMTGKKVQQLKFAWREHHLFAVQLHAPQERIQRQAVRINLPVGLRLPHRLLATEQRFNAGNQLLHGKGFSQIVIRAGFQPGDAVSFTAAGADNNDGQIAGELANATTNFQPVDMRQHQIEDHRIPLHLLKQQQRFGTVGLMGNDVTFVFKM
ncbi:hypothetical protein D3C72_1680300 [compost metagenome]